MDYIEVKIIPSEMNEVIADVLASELAPLGYDSFGQDEHSLMAYCFENLFDADALEQTLNTFPLPDVKFSWSKQLIKTEDWNSAWERDAFDPIVIDNQCVIHAPTSMDLPTCKYDIVIAPKMSFGSGHHETTSQILETILSLPLEGKRVLDMGTGTAVLAILAAKCGASQVRAIEIDDWVAANAQENVEMNHVENVVEVQCGDASLLSDGAVCDVVLANINRNIILGDIDKYVAGLVPQGTMILSGFYDEDVPVLLSKAQELGLTVVSQSSRNHWAMLNLIKL